MLKRMTLGIGLAVVLLLSAMTACSSSDSGGTSGSVAGPTICSTNPGGALQPFSVPCDPGANGILFTASGEVLALGGYAFPPANPDDPAFVDGWDVHFEEVLVTVDKVTLSDNPDKNPGDQAQTDGVVAEVDGPWAVDLHQGGPLAGKGGTEERAVPIAALTGQNKNGNIAFDLTKRYALGFDAVPATKNAQNVNLDAQGQSDYADMIAKGYVVLYVGTATFKGTACTPTDPEFDKLPKVVKFRFGFTSPTTYLNCQNPDNDPAKGFGDEEHQRGVYAFANKTSIAQITMHTDHPFWEGVAHDSPAHFDQVAAQYVGKAANPTATLEDMKGVDFSAFNDAQGNKLPWRNCVGASYTPPDTGAMYFDANGLPTDPSDATGTKLRDYADYMTYNQSTQGHVNSDGLCYIRRNYPSPP